ncbi:hypothetical protein MaudCBS49596_003812 [Microsporum audouinii]
MKSLTRLFQGPDPYSYTAGRWLNRDELQRTSRALNFDFPLLCEMAVKSCHGASKVAGYKKKEGGYNRVFIFTMDTGRRIVARVPTQVAGPPRLTTNSEVATIAYLRLKTALPIPNVLLWSDDPSNPVGIEYIIQEYAEGVQLHEQWPNMDTVQHMLCTKGLSLKVGDMAALDFPAYGNIYFADAPIEDSLKIPLEESFCIGPYCSPLFWNCGAGEAEIYDGPSPNRGPWRTLAEYTTGLVDTARSRVPSKQPPSERLPFRGTVQEHTKLINECQRAMKVLSDDDRVQAAAAPALVHPDYHKRNIFVSPDDPAKVTGLIDWQLAAIEPAFVYIHSPPDFASIPERSETEDEEGDKPQSEDEERLRKDISICHQTHDVIMSLKIPKTRAAKRLDPAFFRLFHYCFTTWRDGVPAIRQELLDLRSLWSEMQLPGDCPYVPSEEELRKHAVQYEDFETMQRLKTWLKQSLHAGSDGWVPIEIWDAAQEANRAAYAEWMETAKAAGEGEGMTMDKADRLWPFDAR